METVIKYSLMGKRAGMGARGFFARKYIGAEQSPERSYRFSDVGIGDPACDLVIAWSLLNVNSRSVFKQHLQDIDENTWQRGRGWALSIASIMLPYYKDTNPVLAELARRIIENVLSDS